MDSVYPLVNFLSISTLLFSLQLVLIFLIRRHVRNYFGIIKAYYIWALFPLWNALILISFSAVQFLNVPIGQIGVQIPTRTVTTMGDFVPALDSPAADFLLATNYSSFNWQLWAAAIWFGGVLLFASYHIAIGYKLNRMIRLSGKHQSIELLTNELACIGFPPDQKVRVLNNLHSPAIYGIFKPILLLPGNFFKRFDGNQRANILSHELVHFRRRDNLINLVVAFIQGLFWFNPLFYWAAKCIQLDQELSCDFAVIANKSETEKKAYLQALFDLSARPAFASRAPEISYWGSNSHLIQRAKSLASNKAARGSRALQTLTAGALTLFGVLICFAIMPSASRTINAADEPVLFLPAVTVPEAFTAIVQESESRLDFEIPIASAVPSDSEYLAFVVDTSGSMLNNSSWSYLQGKIPEIMQLYPRLKGFQFVNDMGIFLDLSYVDSWIPYTAENLQEAMTALSTWNPYSNSSPLEGISRIINIYGERTEKVSIYVLGDDAQEAMIINDVLFSVQEMNRSLPGTGGLLRVHAVMFSTLLAAPPQYRNTGMQYLALMRAMTYQNGGTFELISLE